MTTHSYTNRLRGEGGWVLVSAISLMSVMLIIAFASMSLVDMQQTQSRKQRERESALNLAEGVLYAQGFKLAQNWPGVPTNPAPNATATSCASTATAPGCPLDAEVRLNVHNVDTLAGTTWTTTVRDNGGQMGTAFQTARMNDAQSGTNALGAPYTCDAPCRWDANGDRKVWVQARGVVRGRPRNVVATLKLERLAESTPRTAVTAGGINTNNRGGQVKIYAVGSQVVVRCSPTDPSCVSGSGISPAPVQGSAPPMLTPLQLERFRRRAVADGTYHLGCPPNNDLRGEVVFVEYCETSMNWSNIPSNACPTPPGLPPKPIGGGNGLQGPCINTVNRPGYLIWHCGRMQASGNATFVGVMYFVNNSDNPQTGPCAGRAPIGTVPPAAPACDGGANDPNHIFASSGGNGIWGALAIDGNGCLYAGSNGLQVQFDGNAFNAVASYGTVGLVQDTWRELTPS